MALLSFRRLLAASIALTVWSIWLFYTDTRTKEAYPSITGEIVYIGNTYQDLPGRHHGKMRYILVNNYPSVFELFVGKDAGDFKPKYEQIDSLREGDEIKVHFLDEVSGSTLSTSTINHSVQYIEKDGELYFEKGNSKLLVFIVLIFLSASLAVMGLILWKKKKIPY